ncbi:MAG: DUF4249 domain-containing protein [Bacteroidales bacterium]|nr:DUF4249 domain-containing protein [Bacteroidales bacterium]
MRKLIFAIIPAAMLALSCEKEIKFTGNYDGEKLVLFSLAEPGHPLSVQVRKSRFFLGERTGNPTQLLSGVTVQARSGNEEISFERDEEGVYRSSYVPSEGDHIEISASMEGFASVRAETTVPRAPEVTITRGETRLRRLRSGNDYTLEIHFKLTFHDRAGERDRYKVSMYTKNYITDDRYYAVTKADGESDPHVFYVDKTLKTKDMLLMESGTDITNLDIEERYAFFEYLEDGSFDGEDRVFDVWCESYVSEETALLPNYGLGDYEWVFDILSLSEDQYSYLVSLQKYCDSDDLASIFGEPVCIHNNVKGGIGCFGSVSGICVTLK